MTFEQHIKEIENPSFQIQFVALSGYSVLELILEQHEYVRPLVAGLSSGEVLIEEVYQRILYLLPRVEKDVGQSCDGSIVVYLYCLSKFDSTLSYEASVRIRGAEGLFWSRRMARKNVKRYWDKQIKDSIRLTSTFDLQSVKLGAKSGVTMHFSSPFASCAFDTSNDSRQYVHYPHPIEPNLSTKVAS